VVNVHLQSDSTAAVSKRRFILIAAMLVGLVLVVFGRSLFFDFVAYDDFLHVVDNPHFHPVTFDHVMELWKAPYKSVYMPVTYSLWGVLAKVSELPVADEQGVRFNPYIFHAVNVLLHLINVLLVWRILGRLMRSPWAAGVGAAIFAVHPLQVEAVAWVSSTKDLLSGMFALLAILFYLRFAQLLSRKNYVLAAGAFALALLSKATTVVVPLVILVLLVMYVRGHGLRWLWPWFLVVPPFLWLTRSHQEDASLLVWSPIWARPLEAMDAISFYLFKLFWPVGMTIDYGRSPEWLIGHPKVWVIWILPVVLAIAIWWRRKRFSEGVAGGLTFIAALLPVLGFVPFEFQGYSTVADRYVYLSMLGVALAAAGLFQCSKQGFKLVGIVVIVGLALLSTVQVGTWRDSSSLFGHAIAVRPESGFGWYGIGGIRERGGDLPGAAEAYRRAVEVRPDDVQALSNLSNVLMRMRAGPEAAKAYAAFVHEAARRVLLKYPDSALGHRKMGTALGIEGRTDDAVKEFELAIRDDPSDAAGYLEYGDMLQSAGRFGEAVEQYRAGLRVHPENGVLRERLGRASGATTKN
jgi:protein O-mannosyl-transferase